jgi:hypothetical protein
MELLKKIDSLKSLKYLNLKFILSNIYLCKKYFFLHYTTKFDNTKIFIKFKMFII